MSVFVRQVNGVEYLALGIGREMVSRAYGVEKEKTHFLLSRQLMALYFPLPVEWASEA